MKNNPLEGFKPILKTCPVCGKSFMPTGYHSKYCSKDCSDAYYRNYYHERHKANYKPKQPEEKVCPFCGKTFSTIENHKIYCSTKCRNNAHYYGKNNATSKIAITSDNEKDCRNQAENARERKERHERNPLVEKICPKCGKSFVKTTHVQVYCSKECFNAFYADYYREYRKTYLQKIKAERDKVKVEKICPKCGKTFIPTRKNQVHCSSECSKSKQKAEIKPVSPQVVTTVDTSKLESPSTSQKICPTCGKYFKPRHCAQEYCSVKCYKQIDATQKAHGLSVYSEKLLEKTCARCGKTFKTSARAVKVCADCRQEIAEERKKKQKLKHICLQCGKIYSYSSVYKDFCSAACKDAYKQHQQAAKKPQPEAERRDPNKKTIEQWQKEAEQCGLSYGYYRAQIERFGKTFEELVK